MTPAEFEKLFDVPRGTMQQLDTYVALLKDWQGRMNLVGPATLDDIWGRHFADSAQLKNHVPAGQSWLDIGAGAGFPGMVLAALGWGRFHLVDSVGKKARFLNAVRQELNLHNTVSVHCARVESLPPLGVDLVTARAAAPLATLLDWALRHLRPGGRCVFPKGRRWADEVSEAEALFSFDLTPYPSMTDPEARILLIEKVKRR